MTSTLGFKAGMNSLLAGSRAFLILVLADHEPTSIGGNRNPQASGAAQRS